METRAITGAQTQEFFPTPYSYSSSLSGDGNTTSSTSSSVSMSPLQAASMIQQLREWLLKMLPGQERMVEGAIVSLLSGYPAVFIGPPGTAKTTTVELIARALNVRYAYRLLTKFTTPEELFGPVDVVRLRNEGKYVRRIQNTIVDAELPFLDEIFKASSAILNTLLDVLFNRRFFDGEKMIRVPWITLYSASNEVPKEKELQALYDRFLIRVFIKRVPEQKLSEVLRASFEIEDVLSGVAQPPSVPVEAIIALRKYGLQMAREALQNQELVNKYLMIVGNLRQKGYELSERRIVQTLRLAGVIAAMYGGAVTVDDIIDALLFTVPTDEDDVEVVMRELEQYRLQSDEYLQKIVAAESLAARLESGILSRSLTKQEFVQIKSELKKLIAEIDEASKKGLLSRSSRAKMVELAARLQRLSEVARQSQQQ